MESRRHILYVLREPDSGVPRYVGITALSMQRRYNAHVTKLDANKYKFHWIRKLKRQGKLPVIESVAVGLSADEACDLEILTIRGLKERGFPLVNLSTGGRLGALGVKRSELERKAISERLKGEKNHWWGKRFSPEHRRKIGDANMGKRAAPEACRKISTAKIGHAVSPETRAKISAQLTGKRLSEECRAKISAAFRGRKLSPETRAKLRAAHLGKVRGPLSPEHKMKVSQALRSRKLSAEHRNNLSKAMKRYKSKPASGLQLSFL